MVGWVGGEGGGEGGDEVGEKVWEARAVYLRANREPRDIRVFSSNKLRASNTSGQKFKIQGPQIWVKI